MSAQTSNGSRPTSDSGSDTETTNYEEECLPDIVFEGPTEEESRQIKSALSDVDGLAGMDAEDLRSFFFYESPPESIGDDARISIPDAKSSSTANGNSYASFGDDGTTVTVNAYGNILQITRSLGFGHSGLFSVDISGVCEPTSPQSRLEQLMQLAMAPDGGIRLNPAGDLEENLADAARSGLPKPRLDFIFNRWPRFTLLSTSTSSDSNHMSGSNGAENAKNSRKHLQYFCHKGTVFQKYTFSHNSKTLQEVKDGLLYFRRNFLIRTLDFTNESTFNDDEYSGDKYVYLSGPEKLSHITAHVMTQSDAKQIGIDEKVYQSPNGPRAVALVITVFVNGEAQVLHGFPLHLFIQLSERAQRKVESSERVEITIAYRLQVLTNKHNWKQSCIPAATLASMGDAFRQSSTISFQKLRWSAQEDLNFIIQRNLEHILSVCSIPSPKSSNVEENEMDRNSLALTCGDISGHRVANTAAFFAFEFLIECLKYLCDSSKKARHYRYDSKDCKCVDEINWTCSPCRKVEAHLHNFRIRILQTLQGHIKWTEKAQRAGNSIKSHYWITGKEIPERESHRFSIPAPLTDMPFQIIKVHSLYQFHLKIREENGTWDMIDTFKENNRTFMYLMEEFADRNGWRESLGNCIRSWLRKLYESDNLFQYAFSRSKRDDGKKYHLADHVWICRAVRCVEELGLGDYLDLTGDIYYLKHSQSRLVESKPQADHQAYQEPVEGKQSEELQRVVLKRFTTRNPKSRQRMLATSRTPSETRFLFHAKDTALFYAMDCGFFDLDMRTNSRPIDWTNKIVVWKETVEVQADHEETQTLEWEKPLWYALALIISSKRKRINKTSANETLHNTAEILFELSSESGLFPGLLNDRREPIVFENELWIDKYWNSTFEIPYTMWVYGKGPLEASLDEERLQRSPVTPREEIPVRTSNQLLQPMKKKMNLVLFRNPIEKRPLIEISDDWLREIPKSLNFDDKLNFTNPFAGRHVEARTHSKDCDDFGRDINSSLGGNSGASCRRAGVVIDVPKGSSNSKICLLRSSLWAPLQTNSEIQNILAVPRTVQRAKKRLIWLPQADRGTVSSCCKAASQTERDNLFTFFDRHATYENHFSDYTSQALNEWVTELHLSYFRRTDWDSTNNQIREKDQYIIPELSCILVDPQMMPGHDDGNARGAKIVRSVMSFRIIGDFSDRYWTCHFLECDPAQAQYGKDGKPRPLADRLSKLGTDPVQEMKSPWRERQPWQQRKVLELLLLDYVLEQIISSTNGLLLWVRDVILKKDRISKVDGIDMVSVLEKPFRVRATKPLNPLAEAVEASVESLVGNEGDGLFSIAERWRFFEQVLRIMEEDLSGNLQVISSWTNREREREAEGLRWTRNDQMLYQQVIDRLRISNQRKMHELDGLKVAVRTFRDTFTRKLDTMRSDLEYRYSENTSLFTYVTVVFLPLGFATGILSMSGTPDRPTLITMIQLALVAMGITLFALANARTTGKKIVQPIITIFRSFSNGSLNPILDVLLPPFRILKNIFLLLGTAIKFFFLVVFHQFVSLPLIHALGPSNVESIKNAYHSIQEASKSIEEMLAAERNKNPLEVAERRFNARKSQREDVENGEQGKSSFRNSMAGT